MNKYKTTSGEAWDAIAKKLYGSELYADFLMKNNTDKLDIFIFPSDVILNAPELTSGLKTSGTLPDWRN